MGTVAFQSRGVILDRIGRLSQSGKTMAALIMQQDRPVLGHLVDQRQPDTEIGAQGVDENQHRFILELGEIFVVQDGSVDLRESHARLLLMLITG